MELHRLLDQIINHSRALPLKPAERSLTGSPVLTINGATSGESNLNISFPGFVLEVLTDNRSLYR